jgi:hypothetical protein
MPSLFNWQYTQIEQIVFNSATEHTAMLPELRNGGIRMKPLFAEGTGCPPVYLYDIKDESAGAGKLVFSGGILKDRQVSFLSKRDLLAKLQLLIVQKVPLSAGGHGIGPADEVQLWLGSGDLTGVYVEISWRRQGNWVVREIVKGATEWDEAVSAGVFATTNFDPASLEV